MRRRNRSGRSVNTSSSVLLAAEQTHQVASAASAGAQQPTSDDRNFVYKVVSLSGGSTTPKPPPPVVFVTAPPDVNNHGHYYPDESDALLRSAFIVGLRVEDADSKGVSYDADGTPNIQAGKPVTFEKFKILYPLRALMERRRNVKCVGSR